MKDEWFADGELSHLKKDYISYIYRAHNILTDKIIYFRNRPSKEDIERKLKPYNKTQDEIIIQKLELIDNA